MKKIWIGFTLLASIASFANDNMVEVDLDIYGAGTTIAGNIDCDIEPNKVCELINNESSYASYAVNIECKTIEVKKSKLVMLGQNIRYGLNMISGGVFEDCSYDAAHKGACNSSSSSNVIFEKPFFYEKSNGEIGASYGSPQGKTINLVKSIECE